MSVIGRAAARHQATDAIGQSLLGLGGSLAWSRLTVVLLLFALPPLLPNVALLFADATMDKLGGWGLVLLAAWAVLAPILTAPILAGAYTTALTRHRAGDRGPLGDFVKLVARDLVRGFPLGVVVGALACAGFALFIIPGFLIQIAFLVAAPAYVLERKGFKAALSRSLELTRGIRWNLLASLVLLGVITGFIAQFLTPVLAIVVGTVLQATFSVAVYLSRRQQLEDLYLAQLGAEAGYVPQEDAPPTDEQLDQAIADIRRGAARTRKMVALVLVGIVAVVAGIVGKHWYAERQARQAIERSVQQQQAEWEKRMSKAPSAPAATAPTSARDAGVGPKSEFDGLSGEELVTRLNEEPEGSRKELLGKVLSARGVDLYGPGLAGVFRQLFKARPEQRDLAILPGLSREVASIGCSESLTKARAQAEGAAQSRYYLTHCKPTSGKRVTVQQAPRAPLYATVLATVLAARAAEQQTETDPLHVAGMRVLLAGD